MNRKKKLIYLMYFKMKRLLINYLEDFNMSFIEKEMLLYPMVIMDTNITLFLKVKFSH